MRAKREETLTRQSQKMLCELGMKTAEPSAYIEEGMFLYLCVHPPPSPAEECGPSWIAHKREDFSVYTVKWL